MSGVAPVNFKGRNLLQSGYYADRNTEAASQGGATSSNLVIIGECKAGIPYNASAEYPNSKDRINYVSNTTELKSILRDGAAYYGALFALTPSNQQAVYAPSKVGIVRVNPAVQGSSTVKDIDADDVITLKSKDYGLYTNQIRRKISAGTTEGKKIIVKFENQTIEGDNISYNLFTLIYTGTGAACALTLDPKTQTLVTITGSNAGGAAVITTADTTGILPGMTLYAGGTADITGPVVGVVQSVVTNTSITINQNITNANTTETYFFKSGTLNLSVSTVPADSISIDLDSFDTVGNLVAYFETLSNYSAILTGDGTYAVNKLDAVIVSDAVNVKTIYTVRAIMNAVIDWVNSSSVYLVASQVSLSDNRIPANDTDYVFLTGGSEGTTPDQDDWQNAIDDVLAENDISLCGVMTDNTAVHAYLSAHCTYMSGVDGRNERQAIVGSGSADTKSVKISEAANINNSLVGYAGTEIYRYDKNGDLTLFPGYYYAALLLGLFAGNNVTFAATNKQLNIVGTKEKYSSSTKDDYIKAGIMIAAESDAGGLRTVRSVTTYQGTNKIDNEFSAVRTSLFITKDHRIYVEELIGEAGDTTALESLKNRAEIRLETYVENGQFVVDPQYGNAYRDFVFTVEGDVVKITYEGTLVLPINFVLVNHNFTIIGVKK
jgi:hypothetical protein